MSTPEHGHDPGAPGLLDQLADVVVAISSEGRIGFANRATLRRFGFEPKSLVGRSFFELLVPDDRERARGDFHKVVSTGQEQKTRCRVTRAGGGEIELEVHFSADLRSEGETAICAVCRELTPQPDSNDAERARHARFQALFESGLEATALASASGQLRHANRRFRALFPAVTDLAELDPTRASRMQRAWTAAETETEPESATDPTPASGVGEFAQPAGRTVALRWTGIHAETGERLIAVQAQERPALQGIIDAIPDRVFVCDLDGTLRLANAAAQPYLAAQDTEDSRREIASLLDLIDSADRATLLRDVFSGRAMGLPWKGTIAVRADPGRPGSGDEASIPVSASITPFALQSDASRASSALLVHLRDLRPQLRVEEALHQTELRLGQSQKLESVGRLAGGIAHDFNNLLTAIIGYSDLVLDALAADHAARSDLEEILRAAERAGGLTRQLLTFSRRQAVEPTPVDLNAVVADIDRMLRRLIGENIELVSRLAGELDTIVADPGQIEQVIVNLVVNARDAMPRGGRIEIETANYTCATGRPVDSGELPPGAYVALRVFDTGTGISETIRRQIFEPFFTTKSSLGGTGLGLASVLDIVLQSRGQIEVESALDRGSCFTVYLPVATAAPRPTIRPPRPIAERGPETVLLVEDSTPVRRLIERTLEHQGYTVLAAESATAALRHCSRHEGPIDLILSDVVLPRMAGPELVAQARTLRPESRVLFMSGFTDETLTRHGLSAGAPELLEKPFGAATLLERVRRQLDAPLESPLDAPDARSVEPS